jgi:hypothetical protein
LTLPAVATLQIGVTRAGQPAPWPIVVAERSQGEQERLTHGHSQIKARGDARGTIGLQLEPGRHALSVSQGGRSAVAHVELAAGESRTLAIDLP